MATSRSRGADVVDAPVADADRPRRDLLEPGDHAQRGRLAAARGADEHHELAVTDVEVQRPHGLRAVRKTFHTCSSPIAAITSAPRRE